MPAVCRECYRLGPAELAYRQAIRNIDRALRFGVTIPRRQRGFVESFLTHSDSRIRARDRQERADFLQAVRDDEARLEMMAVELPRDVEPYDVDKLVDDAEDIPF